MRPAVFAHVPRTGGQAVRAALGLSMHEIHLTLAELRSRRGAASQVFTFVRDPWDRTVSIYAFLHRQREIGERYKEDIECFGHQIPAHASGA